MPFAISADNKCTISVHKMAEKQLHIRMSEEEYKKLVQYCKQKKRTQSDVVRELIRRLVDGD
ncbi:RepB family protein [Microseira wollei]|uniref:RepB family protein n=1 Tax=Microseira wollei TaxID=467598 RepID=UPI001CFCDA0A|nr:RepB family protein [Microseira wollei]